VLKLDGAEAASGVQPVAQAPAAVDVCYTPDADLTPGWHKVELTATDDLGNTTTVHWKFFVAGPGITIYNESPADGTTVADPQPLISASFADAAAATDPSTLAVSLSSSGNVAVPVYISYWDATCFYAFPAYDLDPGTWGVSDSQ
jgi:hypothetical protein